MARTIDIIGAVQPVAITAHNVPDGVTVSVIGDQLVFVGAVSGSDIPDVLSFPFPVSISIEDSNPEAIQTATYNEVVDVLSPIINTTVSILGALSKYEGALILGTMSASGGYLPLSYSCSVPWVSIDSAGNITGTVPSPTGLIDPEVDIVFTATDSVGGQGSTTITLFLYDHLSIETPDPLYSFNIDEEVDLLFETFGGIPAISLSAPITPPGLTFSTVGPYLRLQGFPTTEQSIAAISSVDLSDSDSDIISFSINYTVAPQVNLFWLTGVWGGPSGTNVWYFDTWPSV